MNRFCQKRFVIKKVIHPVLFSLCVYIEIVINVGTFVRTNFFSLTLQFADRLC